MKKEKNEKFEPEEVIKLLHPITFRKGRGKRGKRKLPDNYGHELKFANACRNKFVLPFGRIGGAREGLVTPIK